MNLITKRQLPNVNNERIGQLNSPVIIKLNLFMKKTIFFLTQKRENNIQHAQQNLTSFKQITSLVDKVKNNILPRLCFLFLNKFSVQK